ncbi:hypothetical protein T261_3066 [Streptomyces lydicus]|nr:hypothetical protein T261_3066 [Streptomyces lydicus]
MDRHQTQLLSQDSILSEGWVRLDERLKKLPPIVTEARGRCIPTGHRPARLCRPRPPYQED